MDLRVFVFVNNNKQANGFRWFYVKIERLTKLSSIGGSLKPSCSINDVTLLKLDVNLWWISLCKKTVTKA